MKVPLRIYFDKQTGFAIQETGGFDDVWLTNYETIEEQIPKYKSLSERNRDTFDVIELPFGTYQNEFTTCTSYRVNPTTKLLEFNYDPLFTLDDYKQFKKDEMFAKYTEELLAGFTSSLTDSNGVAYEIFYDEIAQTKFSLQTNKVNLLLNRLSLGQITQTGFDAYFPIPWRTKNLGIVYFTYDNYLVITDEIENHERSLLTKRLQKEGYIDTLTDNTQVQAVVW